MEEWLVRIKSEAERVGEGIAWLDLLDLLVYKGNTTLALVDPSTRSDPAPSI